MLREINEQYQNHPEWTDVLMEEKRCLTDTMKALGRDEACSDLGRGKSELLKLWRAGEERWKMMWTRAIKFIFSQEGSQSEVEAILA